MSDGPQKTRYDTSRLEEAETAERPGFDTEGPTRPMRPQQVEVTEPTPVRPTAPYPNETNPYATTPAAPTHAYMPPAQVGPQPVMMQQPQYSHPSHPSQPLMRPPQRSLAAQFGVTQNFAAMACYVPFIGIAASVLLTVAEPQENRFLRFHSKQSLVAHVAFWVLTISFTITRAFLPSLGNLILLLPQLGLTFAAIAGFVYMMIAAYRWQKPKIPVIGDQVE